MFSDLLNALLIASGFAVFLAVPLLMIYFKREQAMLAKRLLYTNFALFGIVVVSFVLSSGFLYAAEVSAESSAAGGDYGMAFIAAALATGIGSIGAGLAVAAAAPAAIGALAEDPNTFGKAMIFVGLGEGLAIFGLLVSILILQKVP